MKDNKSERMREITDREDMNDKPRPLLGDDGRKYKKTDVKQNDAR
jgi:hypothetical protein